MTLFTKSLCSACQEVKREFDLKALGVEVEELEPGNPEALAHLAWHELVEEAEKSLPILVLNDSSAVTDVEVIRSCLQELIRDVESPTKTSGIGYATSCIRQ